MRDQEIMRSRGSKISSTALMGLVLYPLRPARALRVCGLMPPGRSVSIDRNAIGKKAEMQKCENESGRGQSGGSYRWEERQDFHKVSDEVTGRLEKLRREGRCDTRLSGMCAGEGCLCREQESCSLHCFAQLRDVRDCSRPWDELGKKLISTCY